jgi:hypothetical protein
MMKNTLKALVLALSLSGLAHAGTVADVAKHGSMKETQPGPRETVQCDTDGCEMSATQIIVKSKAFAQATRPTELHMNMSMDCAIVPGSELATCDMKIKTQSSDK